MTKTLQDTLSFDTTDLEANRTGTLSEMQHYNLRVRRRRSLVVGLGLMFVFAFIATLFLYQGRDILTFIGIGVTLCNAAMLGIFGRFWMRITADIRNQTVTKASGKLERVVKPINRTVWNYLIRVDETEIYVPKETFEAFEHKLPYTLYMTRYTGMLLSAEKQA
jgi:hypothetical protein